MQDGKAYYYLHSIQGDVIGLARATTGKIVVTYKYDAWGNCRVVNAEGYTIGNDNPFRYRGYYYDDESGLYYLNSRYYDPEVGRFISADSIIDNRGVNTQNLFAYCGNNPVNCSDPSGNIAAWVVSGIVGGLIGAATGAISAAVNDENILKGAAVGFLSGAASSILGGAVGSKVIVLVRSGNLIKAGTMTLGGSLGIGATAGAINAGSQLVEYNHKTKNSNSSVKDISFLEYVDKDEIMRTTKFATIMAPVAMMTSATVDSAFSNPKTFDLVSEAIGYGIANACMDGNVSLMQTIIEVF